MRVFGLLAAGFGLLLFLGSGCAAPAEAATDNTTTSVRLITIDGAVTPATNHYVTNQIAKAEAANADLILLRIDTPGGLSRATKDIVQAILASPVPVVGYVAPSGARAASAGTYILYATHIAAMAPATHLGAATPVSLGGSPSPPPADNKKADSTQSGNRTNQSAKRRKVINDAVAFIRSLAQQRDRNADWAETAVREAATLTAAKALEANVIDRVAANRSELLGEIDGMTVRTVAGQTTLHTNAVQLVRTEPSWRTQLLSVVAQPMVAYLLLMIGIVGLLLEGLSPGTVLPGVVGGICLLVSLYAFQMLPVNYAGLALIVLGIALMVGELFAPSFGVLGLGGIAAFAFGSVMLMDTSVPGYDTPLGFIIGLSIFFALMIMLVLVLFMRARHKRIHTGSQGLIGSHCYAMQDFNDAGRVWLHSEAWNARCNVPVHKNEPLEVVDVEGLTVQVRPVEQSDTIKASP